MECNRDEALRAKEIAERKFKEKNVGGAKRFALKAQSLFPALEGISQMIATLDVYLASESKVYGEKDLYAILNVNASADEDTIRKHYKKLALQLHPDKNKSVGAEGAFQFVSEAWSVLSDKWRRNLYDQKRNIKGFHQKPYANQANSNNFPNPTNGLHNFAKAATAKAQPPKSSSTHAAPNVTRPTVRRARANSFWTSCDKCKIQYEYLRIYINHNILCPNCREPFLAKELLSPANGPLNATPWPDSTQHHSNLNQNPSVRNRYGPCRNNSPFRGTTTTTMQHGGSTSSNNNENFQWGPFSRTAGAASAAASSSAAAQAANVVHRTYEKVRREREEAQAAAKKEEMLQKRLNAMRRNAAVHGVTNAGSTDNFSVKKRKGNGCDHIKASVVSAEQGNATQTERPSEVSEYPSNSKVSTLHNRIISDLSRIELRKMLIDMTKIEIDEKLEEWKSADEAKAEEKEQVKKKQKQDNIDGEEGRHAADKDTNDQENLAEPTSEIKQFISDKHLPDEPIADTAHDDEENIQQVSIDVPDPDFHDFDKDRSEHSFGNDEVWATYDEEDGMPRYYALIQKVLSRNPFKVRMSFLSSKSNSEFGSLDWVASGFAKTCGYFRIGRYDVNDTINIFSHKVRWEKGPRGVIKIIPMKGETWALYRNWSPSWDEHTPEDIMYKYDMVEILGDYDEKEGIVVGSLVKVAGFKTVFRRHMDPKETRRIPKEEMFRFSHQVPSYTLTGEEAENAPKGCRELDPAATPLELLQVIQENKTSSMDAEQPFNNS